MTRRLALGKMLTAGAVAVLLQGLAPAWAQDLKLAMSSPPSSIDPHFHNLVPNTNISAHLFEALLDLDPNSRIQPGLAESWKQVNDTTWEFKIRRGAKFSDGSLVTAEDVIYSLNRPATVKNSPAPFTTYTRSFASLTAVDAGTVRLVTREPVPLLAYDLSSVFIVSKKAADGLSTEDFNSGKGMIGSGPYRFVRYLRDDRIELARNEHYNGDDKSHWATVTIRFIPNAATRLAALLAGDVQAIENIPTPDLARLRGDPNFQVLTKTSARIMFLFADWRDKSLFVTDKAGNPLAKNPLQDVRVRRALSMAINRDALRDRVMEGLAEPSEALVPMGMSGHNANLKTVRFDPEGAKKLLAEAGYPNGFGLTVHGPNNRFVNDEKVTQAIAQMFTRVGVESKVQSLPMAVYAPRGGKFEFSVSFIGWGGVEASSGLRGLVACENAAKGLGVVNWSKYCNPKLDALLGKALSTMDDTARDKLLQEAATLVSEDVALIPLYFQVSAWGVKKGISYAGRRDERTFAQLFKPQ